MRRLAVVSMLVIGMSSAAWAETITVMEARVWVTGDKDSMRRMGTQPRVTVEVNDGKVGPAACQAVSKGTKWGRVLWGMKGKAHEFKMRAPIDMADGKKKTITGLIVVDASGGQTVKECALSEYEAAKDDKPVWPIE